MTPTTPTDARPDLIEHPTHYIVSYLPDGHPEQYIWGIEVMWRSVDKWSVSRMGGQVSYSRTGEWHHEPVNSEKTKPWKQEHRYSFDEAMALARELAWTMPINGLTAADVLAKGDWWKEFVDD